MATPPGSPLTHPATSPIREAPFSSAHLSFGAQPPQTALPLCAELSSPFAAGTFPGSPDPAPPEPLVLPSATADPANFQFAPPKLAVSPTSPSPSSPLTSVVPPPLPPLSPALMQGSVFSSTPLTTTGAAAAPVFPSAPSDTALVTPSVASAGIPVSSNGSVFTPIAAAAAAAAAAPTSPFLPQGTSLMDTTSSASPPAPLPPMAQLSAQQADNAKAIVLYSPPAIPALATLAAGTGIGAGIGMGGGAGAGRSAEREAVAAATALAARAAVQQWPVEKLKVAWMGASPMERRVLGGMMSALLQGQPIQILGGSKLLEALQLRPPADVGSGQEAAAEAEAEAQAEAGEEVEVEDEVEQAEQQADSLMATADGMSMEQQAVSSNALEGSTGEDVEMAE
ncbi:hypothetical protein CLOP_g10327 [Closterium sp. NIES-67]|nr:hypothetical protein CLOP_g10327 [Closterium sp. NIES-67]